MREEDEIMPVETEARTLREYLITGTRIYGPVTLESDLDVVMYYQDAAILEQYLRKQGIIPFRTEIQKNLNYGGYYFDLLFIRINVIEATSKIQMKQWEKSTEKMLDILPIEDREKRIAKFKSFDLNNVISGSK